MTKRFLALFLGLTLALSLLPQPIRAAAPVDYLPPDPDFGVEFHLRTPSVAGRLTLGEDGKTATLFAPNTTRESGWKDADKNWSNDAALCWAASCSNVLSWYLQFAELEGWLTSGQYENNHDRIFDQFRANWPDLSGQDPVTGMSWYFTAGFPSGGPPAENPPSPGSGGYLRALFPDCEMWSKLNFMQPTSFLFGDYATMTPFLDSEDGSYYDYQPLYNHRSFSDTVIRQLHYGPTVLTIGKENAGPQSTHAVTMWGCDYDETTKLVSAIYLTDSDDSQDLLRRIPIKARPGDQGGIRMEGYYPLVGGDARPYTNIVCTDLLFPMNAVYLGDAPTEPTVPVTPVEPSSVSLNQTSLALKKDNSFLLTASVSPAEAENQTVTWNSDAPQIASVDSSGLVTAHCPGQTVITATTWNGHSASCTVTVLPTEVSSIRLNRTSLSLTRKDTFQLSATVSPADADNQNITWISDTPGVASVSRDGLVTAVAAGEARITASADNGQSASCVVTVEPIEVTSVELNRSELTLTRKDTFQLSATVSPADADSQNITWTSDTPGVASVARDGLVTAVAAGKARITASADNGQSASCVVTVEPIEVTSVELNRSELSLTKKDTFQLSATVSPADADNQNITWTSDAPNIASVSRDGLVTAVAAGEAKITASADNGQSASCVVTVEPIEVTSVELNRSELSLTRKDTFQLSATVSPADADSQNITWTSDTPGVASVARDGLVTAVAAGKARITASADNGQSASCVVTVEPIEVTSVELNRSELSLTRKDTFQLSATVSPADADSQNITWTSDTPGVASVARDGLVTAVAAGKARITASADNGQSASCVVTVRPIGVASVTLNQETLVLGRNERFRLSASITPADADNREITWKSEIPGIASVTPEGVVRGVSVGSTVITATAPNGVSASCRVTVELRNPFVDVTDSAYYFAPVLWAVDTGITTGTDATHFSPDAPCTRKQIVTFLWRASGSPAPASTYNPFVDVPHDSFEQAILWAVEMGITSGVDSRHFAPNAPCTRAQAVTFLWRSCGSPRKSGNSFADVPAVSFYAQAVRWAVDNEITEGTDAVHFSPDWICSRGQIVTFLYRMNRH